MWAYLIELVEKNLEARAIVWGPERVPKVEGQREDRHRGWEESAGFRDCSRGCEPLTIFETPTGTGQRVIERVTREWKGLRYRGKKDSESYEEAGKRDRRGQARDNWVIEIDNTNSLVHLFQWICSIGNIRYPQWSFMISGANGHRSDWEMIPARAPCPTAHERDWYAWATPFRTFR